ncbi:malate/L-lactate dehydrogenase [Moelleriella libera RCEF 2490]|uniref:Malate/L-lactate dehydrogenase n=1 Tax=Moelleriella libera RCEF 2490 TaxID=1081109 RepID=A0A167YVI6_9HYPO|nr:malate/L-lactate dehydrogenase [Moelleriella libera RCEF 2490]
MSSIDADKPPLRHVHHTEATRLVTSILTHNGVSGPSAALVAKCLIAADLRGVDTHGMSRVPSYMARIRRGVLDPAAQPSLSQVTPVVAHVDGRNSFGFLGAHMAMQAAITSAETYGIGMASVRRSNHFGMAAWVVQQALDAGMMSIVFTNSSPALPPFGGRSKLLGTSPLACGAPGISTAASVSATKGAAAVAGGGGGDFILDMAPSVAARGKIYKAKRRGERIPQDWALDKDGRPTDDPDAALAGVLLPMGGPKGSALAIMMDVFSGVLSGSAFAGHVTGPYDTSSQEAPDVGHFMLAIKPDLFMNLDEFRGRLEYLYQRVVGAEKAAGVDRIYFPGEMEQLVQRERLETGIPLAQAEIDALNEEAERAGVQPMKFMS